MDSWETTFLLGRPIFSVYVGCREGSDQKSHLFCTRMPRVTFFFGWGWHDEKWRFVWCIIGKSTVWSGAFLQQNPLIRLKHQIFRGNKRKVLFLSWHIIELLGAAALVEWGLSGWWWSTTGWSDQWGGDAPEGKWWMQAVEKTDEAIFIHRNGMTRWWFHFFYIHFPTWGNDPIWQAYFANGLVQPPQLDEYFWVFFTHRGCLEWYFFLPNHAPPPQDSGNWSFLTTIFCIYKDMGVSKNSLFLLTKMDGLFHGKPY